MSFWRAVTIEVGFFVDIYCCHTLLLLLLLWCCYAVIPCCCCRYAAIWWWYCCYGVAILSYSDVAVAMLLYNGVAVAMLLYNAAAVAMLLYNDDAAAMVLLYWHTLLFLSLWCCWEQLYIDAYSFEDDKIYIWGAVVVILAEFFVVAM